MTLTTILILEVFLALGMVPYRGGEQLDYHQRTQYKIVSLNLVQSTNFPLACFTWMRTLALTLSFKQYCCVLFHVDVKSDSCEQPTLSLSVVLLQTDVSVSHAQSDRCE